MSTAHHTPFAALSQRHRAPLPHALCALLMALASLSGCGGDTRVLAEPAGEPSGTAPPPAAPAAPAAAIEVSASLSSVKRLTLSWSSPGLALAQRALILEDPDGDGPLPAEQLADVAAAEGTATVEVFLPTALRASYRVALCAQGQCVQSAALTLGGALERYAGRIKAVAPQARAGFGESVSLSRDGRVLAVTALYESVAVPGDFEGAVHLYEHVAAGQWVPRGQVAAPHPGNGDRFGEALALSGDGRVLVVGSQDEDALGSADGGLNNLARSAGAAYVYRRVGDAWAYSAYLKGSQVVAEAHFGYALDISDDGLRIAVGAPYDSGSSSSDGAVYEFVDSQGSWTQTQVFHDGNSSAEEHFGRSVAFNADGSVLAIGSPDNASSGFGVHAAPIDDATAADSGAVHLYRRSGAAWAYEAFVKPPGDLGSAQFGDRVDLDASGDTLLVAADKSDLDPQGRRNTTDSSHWNSGSVHVLARTNGLWAHEAMLRQPQPRGEDAFGWSARLSADGRTVVVGSYNQDTLGIGLDADERLADMSDFGSAYVFHRLAGGWSTATVLKPSDSGTAVANHGLWFGRSVAISGDGRTVALGAAGHDGPGSAISPDPTITYAFDASLGNSGAVFLY